LNFTDSTHGSDGDKQTEEQVLVRFAHAYSCRVAKNRPVYAINATLASFNSVDLKDGIIFHLHYMDGE